ncbi:MAG TPA: putative glycoside hydrolase [Thermoclostridium sp.]|nr:putative glycoside hydrolase [Thermoclostridium sp.]
MKERRLNPILGIIIIIVGGCVIGILLSMLINDGKNTNNNVHISPTPIQVAGENIQESPSPTTSPTSPPTATPTPSPAPIPTPLPTASIEVKGLYLTTNTVGIPSRLQYFIDLANRTEINSFVIDVKDDYGKICYETQVPLAVKHNAWGKLYDVKEVIDKLHDNNIKVIGRVVCFNDPLMPLKEPDISLKNNSGEVFKVSLGSNSHLAWLDPSKEESWQYIIDISQEAISFGFDEIQYDYVRFPETTNYKYDMSYFDKEKSEYIDDFIKLSLEQMPGVKLSADVFGSVCLQSRDAGGIGQTLETISERIHYISPMIYPSHYANDSNHYSGNGAGTNINGVVYPKPDLEPYNIIYNTLLITKQRLENVGHDVQVRPYLQGFTATYLPDGYYIEYGVEQYKKQIQAVYDAGYTEWIFWNSGNTYIEEAFLAE